MKLLAQGFIQYDPPRSDMKNNTSNWCVLNLPPDLVKLYQYVLRTEKHLNLCEAAWGAHASIVRGEKLVHPEFWKKYDSNKVTIQYTPIIKKVLDKKKPGAFYIIDFECPEFEHIRAELGLQTHKTFHFTIGRTYYE